LIVLPSISSVVGDRGRRGDDTPLCKTPVNQKNANDVIIGVIQRLNVELNSVINVDGKDILKRPVQHRFVISVVKLVILIKNVEHVNVLGVKNSVICIIIVAHHSANLVMILAIIYQIVLNHFVGCVKNMDTLDLNVQNLTVVFVKNKVIFHQVVL